MTQDENHLQLLAIFHFVVAAFTGLFALFPIIHLMIGLAMLSGEIEVPQNEAFPVELMGWLFVLMAIAFILFGLTLAALIAFAGRALQKRTHYTFCIVVAGLSCLLFPFGTVLGVFTIIVLMREPVKGMFQAASQGPASPLSSP